MAKEPFENLPAPPVQVARPSRPLKLALATRSPLSLAFRHIRPGWIHYIQFVELAASGGDRAMVRYLQCYKALPINEKRHCWPEQICQLANVTPGELIGAVCRAIWENKAAESSMVSSIAHPQVLQSTIKFAQREENYHDRELYFRMVGALPDRKGTSINIYNAAAGHVGGDNTKIPELGQGRARLRTFDEEVIEMSRDLEVDAPFLVEEADVPPDSHPEDA